MVKATTTPKRSPETKHKGSTNNVPKIAIQKVSKIRKSTTTVKTPRKSLGTRSSPSKSSSNPSKLSSRSPKLNARIRTTKKVVTPKKTSKIEVLESQSNIATKQKIKAKQSKRKVHEETVTNNIHIGANGMNGTAESDVLMKEAGDFICHVDLSNTSSSNTKANNSTNIDIDSNINTDSNGTDSNSNNINNNNNNTYSNTNGNADTNSNINSNTNSDTKSNSSADSTLGSPSRKRRSSGSKHALLAQFRYIARLTHTTKRISFHTHNRTPQQCISTFDYNSFI